MEPAIEMSPDRLHGDAVVRHSMALGATRNEPAGSSI